MTKPELSTQLDNVLATLELLSVELFSAQDHIIEEADADNLAAKKAKMPFAISLSNLQSTINALRRTITTVSHLDEVFLS